MVKVELLVKGVFLCSTLQKLPDCFSKWLYYVKLSPTGDESSIFISYNMVSTVSINKNGRRVQSQILREEQNWVEQETEK